MTKADRAAKSRAVREFREKRNASIIAMAKQGYKCSAICAALNCHPRTVNYIILSRALGRPRKTTPDAQDAAIIATYAAGRTLRETAQVHGVKFQWVHQVLKRWAPATIRAPYLNKRRQGLAT